MHRADIIVIGAGVLGTFHAYFAAQKGLRVLLIERNALPNDASTRNFGMLPQSIVDPTSDWAAIARASADIYRSLQRECDISVRATGSLYLASTDLEQAVLQEFAQQFGTEYGSHSLEPREVLDRYPFVRASYCRGGLLFPDDLALEPPVMLRRLIPYLVEGGGVRYVPHTTVVGVESSEQGCTVVDAAGARYVADQILVCTGADYRTLFPEMFRSSGLQICKLQMLRTVPVSGVCLRPSILSGLSIRRYPAFTSCPSYGLLESQRVDEELRTYGIHLLLKQSPDGTIVIGDSHEYGDFLEASVFEERTNCRINQVILGYARSMLELPTWNIQAMWNGYYLVHPHDPVFTATLDDRIHIVTGIGGKGMTTGPGFAQQFIESIAA